MDLIFDLQSKALWIGTKGNLAREEVKIRQTEDLRLQFVRGSAPERHEVDAFIFVGIKRAKSDADPLASVSDWTRPAADTGFYTAELNLNTTQINDIFDADDAPDQIEVFIECSWAPAADEDAKRRSDDLKLTLVRSTFTGDEGTPADATDPSEYVRASITAAGYLRLIASDGSIFNAALNSGEPPG